MRKKNKAAHTVDEFDRDFLPAESAESARAIAIDLGDRLVRLEQQVMAQYTATAAYATLAHQHTDTARAEARSDLDRAQSTVIGLIEKLRSEVHQRLDGVEVRFGTDSSLPTGDSSPRLFALDQRVASMSAALEQVLRENHALRNELSELTQRRMSDDGWLASNGPASQLALS